MTAATGEGPVRVAVIDSGVNPEHPHIAEHGAIAGGVWIREDGTLDEDWIDRIGHGTAVAAAIREKAPGAELYAVKIFDRALSSDLGTLMRAIDWAAEHGAHLINLSLGTVKREHEPLLAGAIRRAAAHGSIIVAARDDRGVRWFPGSLPGVVPVQVDWECPREEYRRLVIDGTTVYRASGFPRAIPGVAQSRNLNGISFAVANVTGLLAQARGASTAATTTGGRDGEISARGFIHG
jgi:subtilisin family serine protease